MLYAKEIIELMASFPGRKWKMAHLVNHVARGKPSNKQLRDRYREAVRRVILALVDTGSVRVYRAKRGQPAYYEWRVQYGKGEKREQECQNSPGEVASAESALPPDSGQDKVIAASERVSSSVGCLAHQDLPASRGLLYA